jgi:hypothetical protein
MCRIKLTADGQQTKQKQHDTDYLSIGVRSMYPSENFEEPQSQTAREKTWTLAPMDVY